MRSSEPAIRRRNVACSKSSLQRGKHTQTSLIPESQICQHCGGTSCRFPVAPVSRRSYSQSTQTHHSPHPLRSRGNAGSQLERENRLGEGPLSSVHSRDRSTLSEACWQLQPLTAAQSTKLLWLT